MKSKNHIPFILFETFGEFFILLSAILFGKFFLDSNLAGLPRLLLGLSLFGVLSLGVMLKYIAEKYRKDEL
jgi:hypothetical protein